MKAGFVYNFAKFVEWPANAHMGPQDRLLVCTTGPRSLSGKLALLQGRKAQGHQVEVRAVRSPGDWPSCQILFIGQEEALRLGEILRSVAGAPVLTVGDVPGFVRSGGIFGLKTVDNRVRFDVNLAAARRSGLRISSQILNLATEVMQ